MKIENIHAEKAKLRQEVRKRLKAMPLEERQASDAALFAAFLALPELVESKTILLFYGVKEEPDTSRLIPALLERGKRICLPCSLPEHQMEARLIRQDSVLISGAFQIPEPAQDCPIVRKEELDLILVPNLCCDRLGVRLGQGGGFYDRYLADYEGKTVSLCRSVLLQDRILQERYDQMIQIVLTEEEQLVFETV